MQKDTMLAQLQAHTQGLLHVLETEFEVLPVAGLQFKPGPESWSVLECLEHLNRYARYYHPALETALARSPAAPATAEVGFSWLGRKSYEMMRPENRQPQKTLARMNPAHCALSRAVLDEFRQHQQQLGRLLAQATTTDLNRKAVPVEFFRLLKLQVREALLFVVAHNQRHVQQAQRVVAQLPAGAA